MTKGTPELDELFKIDNIVKLSKEYLSKMPEAQRQSEVSNYINKS